MVTRMVRYSLVMCLGVLLMADLGTAAGRNPNKNAAVTGKSSEILATQAIQDWPSTARTVAQEMIQKYGQPDGVTPDHLMWMNKGNFHEIDVFKEEVEHNFPTRHMDVVKHTVFMRVPPEKIAELAQFDGSLEVNRTRGTLSSFCDSEEHNILALNLAADIINNRKSIQEARQTFASLEAVPGMPTGTATGTGTMSTSNVDHGYVEALRFGGQSANVVRDPGQTFTGGTGTTGMGTGTGTGMGTGTGTGMGTGMGTDTLRGTDTMNRGTGMMNRGTIRTDTLGRDTTGRTGGTMNRNRSRSTPSGRTTSRTGSTYNRNRDTSDTTGDSLFNDTTGTGGATGTGTTPR